VGAVTCPLDASWEGLECGHHWSALNNLYIRENWLQEIPDLKTANPMSGKCAHERFRERQVMKAVRESLLAEVAARRLGASLLRVD
jgi:hypothetical protein